MTVWHPPWVKWHPPSPYPLLDFPNMLLHCTAINSSFQQPWTNGTNCLNMWYEVQTSIYKKGPSFQIEKRQHSMSILSLCIFPINYGKHLLLWSAVAYQVAVCSSYYFSILFSTSLKGKTNWSFNMHCAIATLGMYVQAVSVLPDIFPSWRVEAKAI